MERVLITGAAGGIGQPAARRPGWRLPARCGCPTAWRRRRPGRARRWSWPTSPISPPARRMCAGIDGIVHLGGQAIEADWETVLQANIVGCYNLFEAARRQGVQAGRVRQHQPRHRLLSPRHRASTTRCRRARTAATASARRSARRWARFYADKHGLGVLCIRIGNFGDRPLDRRRLSIWISPRDFLPAGPDRARASGPALRGRLRRLGERPRLVGQCQRLSAGLPAGGRIGAVRGRDSGGRAGAHRSGRRAVPGWPVLLGRVRRRSRPDRVAVRQSRCASDA